ncbi:MAG: sigma-54-dependent Fis family transcriptional regulator [Planctomycetaceae bacterium]|nr:sigma-54-dependent Fis family transcriptional regulator [Planctomycetaceae bacterium]
MEVVQPHATQTVSQPTWLTWSALPWISRGASTALEAQLALRLLESAVEAPGVSSYLRQELPEVASEFAAQWIAVMQRGAEWERLGEFGRQPIEALPMRLITEALDRDAAGCVSLEATNGSATGWVVCAAPLLKGGESGAVLVLCSRGFSARSLPALLTVTRALGWGLEVARRRDKASARIERLQATLEIASQLSLARETKPLLELIAREAARLLDADRASIFVWDREHHEVVACPALGYEGNMLRLKDDTGIVGDCLQTGQSIRVDDAYSDPRFNKQVDAKTGYKTRNLLCVPLVDAGGQRIGAFEVINKRHGDFGDDDQESLQELGLQAAVALANTRERESLVRRHKQLTAQVTQSVEIIGDSPAIAALRTTIERLAATDLPVLVLGESGTGKEVVAQSLHYQGARRESPFVAVNCAAMTETLLESELFGHEKGAFTDAHEARQGKFELAEGGTLFLDEIGDMSPGGQAKLLRVLEQKVITRVGGSQTIRINVRVIAATNVNLAAAVRERRFREDLYYRLSVVALDLPPLRDRPGDILPLAQHFLSRFCVQAGRRSLEISVEARKRLQAHMWPGNIRELRNLMERVAFLCTGAQVEIGDLAFILSPDRDSDLNSTDLGLSEATARFQSEYIRRIVKRVQGNISEASRVLGLHRSNLYRKMRQLDMTEAGDDGD